MENLVDQNPAQFSRMGLKTPVQDHLSLPKIARSMNCLPHVFGEQTPAMGMEVRNEFNADRKAVRFGKPGPEIVSEATEVAARGI